jgi:hypothetical protein
MKKLLFVAFLVVGGYLTGLPEFEVEQTPGTLVKTSPVQRPVRNPEPFEHEGFTVEPLATFNLSARVLSKERYRVGRETDLSKFDLALGWGPMSDSAVLQHIDISQGQRWYSWRVKHFPIPRRAIEVSSANMHMIPANDEVADVLEDVRKGHIIELEGKLVKATGEDGWLWQSSLTREDTGARSCEVIYVERLRIL